MEIRLEEKTSKMVKTFVVEQDGYKANVNLTVNGGRIENLNGSLRKAEAEEERYMDGISLHAYKRNEKWCTSVDGVSNEENDLVTDICVAIVDKIVAEFEIA